MALKDSKPMYKPTQLRIFWAVVSLVSAVLLVLVFFILWLSLQSKKIQYSLVGASITAFNATADRGLLNASFSVALRAENPNRGVSFYHDKINATVQFRKRRNETRSLCTVSVPPFYQRRNATDLALNLTTAGDSVIEREIASNLTTQFNKSGIVELEVQLAGEIRMRIGAFKVHRDLLVNCPARMPASAALSRKKFEKVRCRVIIDF